MLWQGIGVAALVIVLLSAAQTGGGPNYLPLPTIACLRAEGFTVNFLNTTQTPYKLDERSTHWVTRWIQLDGQGLAATFAPTPALAAELAQSSDSNDPAWTRRNVAFDKHTRTLDGPIVGCLSGSAPLTVSHALAKKLAAGGITLSAPHGSVPPSAAGRAAASAASREFGRKKVLEYQYAYCVDSQAVPAFARNCWAVSLEPSGLGGTGTPSTGPASPATYFLVLVDPSDDAVIDSQSD